MENEPLAFELNFTARRGNELVSFDKITGANLVHVLSQFVLVVAMTSRKIAELEARNVADDDIPF